MRYAIWDAGGKIFIAYHGPHIEHHCKWKLVTRNVQPATYSTLHPTSPVTRFLPVLALAVLLFFCVLTSYAAASPPQPAQHENLVQEYSAHMEFSKNQVLDLSIENSVLKLSINECSFCGALKNEKVRSDMAHKTLNWFLQKTGQSEGTVEWYNKSRNRIMVITGSSAAAEITTGPSCAIKK